MKKLITLMLAILLALAGLSFASAEGRDWSAMMPMPTEEQISQPGELRSPYVTFYPQARNITGLEMNLRIDHDPLGTYICPACWFLNVSALEEQYTRVYSDYDGSLTGYLGFQVLESGEKVLIMSLWNAFCEDADGNVTELKPKVLYAPEARIQEHNPETNGEGSFLQCIIPCEWETGKDYHFVLEQETGEEGTEVFTLTLTEAESAKEIALIRFDSGMPGIWINYSGGFVENFVPELAGQIRTFEFRNVKARMRDTGEWEDVTTVDFNVNDSAGIGEDEYAGSWNAGSDDRSAWIITSGVPGLCNGPEELSGYEIPMVESSTLD